MKNRFHIFLGLLLLSLISGCNDYISWSPDGTKLLIAGFPSSGFADSLFIVNSDGSGAERLTGAYERALLPTFLPDNKACYVSYMLNVSTKSLSRGDFSLSICSVDLTTKERKELISLFSRLDKRTKKKMLNEAALFYYVYYACSPDGKWIVYQDYDILGNTGTGMPDIHASLWLYNVASGEIKKMTGKNEEPSLPVWSHDSKQFIYSSPSSLKELVPGSPSNNPISVPELWVMSLNGKKKKISDFKASGMMGILLSPVTWSPDGKKVAYVSGPRANSGAIQTAALYTLTIESGGSELIANNVKSSYPQWSPDGSMIVTEALNENEHYIKVYNFRTRKEETAGGNFAKWSPDSKSIAFWSYEAKSFVKSDPNALDSRQIIFESFDTKAAKAQQYLKKGEYVKAVAVYEEILKLEAPFRPPLVFGNVLDIFKQSGNYEEGARWGEKNIQYVYSLNEKLDMAEMYALAGQYDKAISLYSEIYDKYKDGDTGEKSFARDAKENLDFIQNTSTSALRAYFSLAYVKVQYDNTQVCYDAASNKVVKLKALLKTFPKELSLKSKVDSQIKMLEDRASRIKESLSIQRK